MNHSVTPQDDKVSIEDIPDDNVILAHMAACLSDTTPGDLTNMFLLPVGHQLKVKPAEIHSPPRVVIHLSGHFEPTQNVRT
jgi:hypothetical protein